MTENVFVLKLELYFSDEVNVNEEVSKIHRCLVNDKEYRGWGDVDTEWKEVDKILKGVKNE